MRVQQSENQISTIVERVRTPWSMKILALGLVVFANLIIGCSPPEEITVREMPAWKTGLPEPRALPAMAMPAGKSISGPRRMVVAIAARADATWFFKIDDRQELVDASESLWRPFLQQIQFDDRGQPQWALPPEWQATPGNQDRFATLRIPVSTSQTPGNNTIDLAISSLAANQDLLSNVNRWRGQLGLNPIGPSELQTSLQSIEFQGGQFIVFDGIKNASPSPAAIAEQPPSANSEIAPIPLEFTAPESWVKLPPTMFTAVKFSKSVKSTESTEQEITIAVTPMALRNTWEESISSWLAEAELNDENMAERLATTQAIEVGGVAGKFILLHDESSPSGRAVAAARVEYNDQAWYFKMIGSQSIVLDSQTEFQQFLKSIRFK